MRATDDVRRGLALWREAAPDSAEGATLDLWLWASLEGDARDAEEFGETFATWMQDLNEVETDALAKRLHAAGEEGRRRAFRRGEHVFSAACLVYAVGLVIVAPGSIALGLGGLGAIAGVFFGVRFLAPEVLERMGRRWARADARKALRALFTA